MNNFYNSFSTRDGALFFWLGIFLILLLKQKPIRQSIVELWQAFAVKDILIAVSLYVAYTAICIALMHRFGLWNMAVAKDTLYWLPCSGLPALFAVGNKMKVGQDFLKLLAGSFTVSAFLSAYASIVTFSFFTEVLLLFFLTLLTISVLLSEHKKMILLHHLISKIQAFVGLFIFCMIAFWLYLDWKQIDWNNQLMSFLLPFNLLFASLPFFYGMALFMSYQDIFNRLWIWTGKKPGIHRKAFRRVFLAARVDLDTLCQISRNLHLIDFESDRSLLEMTGRQ